MTTPSIREKFDKARYKMYQEKGIDVSPKDIAIWAFLEGMRVASEVVKAKKMMGDYKDCPAAWLNTAFDGFEKSIKKSIKEFTDDHPK